LRNFNPALAKYILKKPLDAIKMFEDQLNAKVKNLQEDGGKMGGNMK
jgi:hypothetical protein